MVAKESRLPLHSDAVVKFCEGILRGEWKAVEALLTELHVDEDDIPVRTQDSTHTQEISHGRAYILTAFFYAERPLSDLRAEVSGAA